MKHYPIRLLTAAGILLVLLVAACSPIVLPTTTGGTPGSATSTLEGNEGESIPQDGPIATPGAGTITDNTTEFLPQLTVSGTEFSAGSELVIEGQGFPPDSTVRVYLGRPASLDTEVGQDSSATQTAEGTQAPDETATPESTEAPSGTQSPDDNGQGTGYVATEPLVTTTANANGRFSVHTVLPDVPQGAVVNGIATLWAVSDETAATANTIINVGEMSQGGTSGGSTGGTGANNLVDLEGLDFDFNASVLPYLNNVLGSDFQGSDLSVTSMEEVEWTNGCLDLGGEGEMCTQAMVPGYRFLVDVDGQSYEVRSDLAGRVIRLYQPGD